MPGFAPPAALAFAAVAGLAFADGGYFRQAWGWATIALAWAAAAAILLRSRLELGRAGLATLVLLSLFAAWTLASALWAVSPPLAVQEAERVLVYLAGLGAFLLATRRGAHAGLLGGVLGAAALVGAANLLREPLRGPDPGLQGAISWPVGYGNGLALLLALGVVLAVGLAVPTRGASLLVLPVVVAPLVQTGSRGAALALVTGLAALAAARSRLALAGVLALALAVGGVLGWGESPERHLYWQVAAEGVAREPALGSGAGSFERIWLRERETPLGVQDAHSLYLETLAETGPLGLVLLVGALAVPLAAGAARAPAAAGGYAAFVVHAGVDWDWELPAMTLAGLACGAALLVASRPERAQIRRAPAVAAIVALVAVTVAPLVASSRLAASSEAAAQGRWADSESAARVAARWAPWEAEAWLRMGRAQAALGRAAAASSSLQTAVAKDSSDAEAWRELARLATGEERRRALERAALLDPFGSSAAR